MPRPLLSLLLGLLLASSLPGCHQLVGAATGWSRPVATGSPAAGPCGPDRACSER